MTADQIELIIDSFADVLHRRQDAGLIFYKHLFEIAPELQLLFKNNLEIQSRKLITTMSTAVSALHDMPTLVKSLQLLGERHRLLGVHRQDYLPVGRALMATLQSILGDAFDARTREAWITLYRHIMLTMIAGAGYSEQAKVA